MLRLLCALLLVELVAGAVFTIPIKKSDARSSASKWNKRAYRLQDEPLYDYTKEYLGDAHFGTPPQHFKVLFDTGSANTWITDNWCECYGTCKTFLCKLTCNAYCCTDRLVANNKSISSTIDNGNEFPYISRSVDVCAKKSQFDHKKSTTYVSNGQPFSINYGKRTVSGILGSDVFSLGEGGEGLIIPGVTFGQADTLSDDFANDPLEGVIGLAFQADAVDDVIPPLNQAINDGLLDDPIFTVFMKTDDKNVQGVEAGRITIGDIDGDNCDFIMDYAPVTSQKLWQFDIATVTVAGAASSDGYSAVSDTGVSFLGLPQALFDKVISASGASYDKKGGYYHVDCSANFDLSFKINQLDYPLDAKRLVFHINDNLCQLLLFQTNDPSIQIVLGNPFNQQYCMVYDFTGQIGFAKPL